MRSPERPVVPNITALSSTEVRITWCRVHSNKVEIDHYELYIDTELEYSGIDVMYIAKRLKPWSWYEVKLRACGFSPRSCSPFSRPALVKTLRDGKCSCNSVMTTLFKYIFIMNGLCGAGGGYSGFLVRVHHPVPQIPVPILDQNMLFSKQMFRLTSRIHTYFQT